MKKIAEILCLVTPIKTLGALDVSVSSICIDTRKLVEGCAFIAIKGVHSDGHSYIGFAERNGATVIICEEFPEIVLEEISYIKVKNTALIAGIIADWFYNSPSKNLKIIGVTGTNGKTTTATLLYQLFTELGYCCGLISTVENRIGEAILHATHTTPDAISIQQLLKQMVDAGCSHVFMEVSSHAIHQNRIEGIRYAGGIFTNITHDHLDYHKTFDEYIRVKKLFFDNLPETSFAIVNADDKRGFVMIQNSKANKYSYSLKMPANFNGKIIENNLSGLIMNVDSIETHFRMVGTYNAYNLLAVYGTACLLGEEKLNVLSKLSDLKGAKGRFETIVSDKNKIFGVVDYAHTPDALINILACINQLKTFGQKLVTVIGCGGDRDKTKRPLMAQIACEHSDQVILTSDNPRSENPEDILNEMETGIPATKKEKYLRITDRKQAIKTACWLAKPGDILLVAGKGHEDYQEINGVKSRFVDMEELINGFKLFNK